MAPIITAVELTLSPKEAIKMANIKIHKLAPLNSTPLRIDSTVANSLSLSFLRSRYSFRNFLITKAFLFLPGVSISFDLFMNKTVNYRYLAKWQILLYDITQEQSQQEGMVQ